MKIAFVGKGGSGKTTVSSLFARYLAKEGKRVLIIDGDINQHLGETLGLSEAEAKTLPPLGIEQERIKEYVRGENARIEDASQMIKTTPPGPGSRLLSLSEDNDLFRYFAKTTTDGVRVMAVGPFTEDDIGTRCYHSKTGSIELLLNHLIDTPDEYILVDMTAGADSFASGLFTRFDLTFVVVEPTVKSLSVYDQYMEHAKNFEVAIAVIGNKIEDAEDDAFVKGRAGSRHIASLTRSPYVKSAEKGTLGGIGELEKENLNVLAAMKRRADKSTKDWRKYFEQAAYFHEKNAESWGNASVGVDLKKQIDRNFLASLAKRL